MLLWERKALSAHVNETEESGLQAVHPCARRSQVLIDEVKTATVDGSTKPLVAPCARYVWSSFEVNSLVSCPQKS